MAAKLSLTDSQLEVWAEKQKEKPNQFVPLQRARYAEATIGELHGHDPKFTVSVLDILAHLEMFNENRDHGQTYFQLTFTDLNPENYEKAAENVDKAEVAMAHRARIIVDKITKLEEESR